MLIFFQVSPRPVEVWQDSQEQNFCPQFCPIISLTHNRAAGLWSSDLSTVAKAVCLHYSPHTWFHKRHHSMTVFFLFLTLSSPRKSTRETLICALLSVESMPGNFWQCPPGWRCFGPGGQHSWRAVHVPWLELCEGALLLFVWNSKDTWTLDKVLCTGRTQLWPSGARVPVQNTLTLLKLSDGHLSPVEWVQEGSNRVWDETDFFPL